MSEPSSTEESGFVEAEIQDSDEFDDLPIPDDEEDD